MAPNHPLASGSRSHYDRFYAAGGWRYSSWTQKRFLKKRIVAPLGLRRGQRVLDLGCGRGFHSDLLAGFGFEVVGVDASQAGIAAARAAYAAPSFICMDAVKLSERFEPDSFDVIYDRGMSWYHYELDGINRHGVNVPERTRELFDLLKAGGLFVLQIVTDFSGNRPASDIHQNRYNDYVRLFGPLGDIVLVTDWIGHQLRNEANAERSKKNIIIATRKAGRADLQALE
jgi:SAM-dependent methyltransferase